MNEVACRTEEQSSLDIQIKWGVDELETMEAWMTSGVQQGDQICNYAPFEANNAAWSWVSRSAWWGIPLRVVGGGCWCGGVGVGDEGRVD
jgi:hypothetical protein